MESRAFVVGLIVGILATVTIDVVAGVLAVISRAAFSEIGHMRRVGWNLVVISAMTDIPSDTHRYSDGLRE
jgi:hypothetical protein